MPIDDRSLDPVHSHAFLELDGARWLVEVDWAVLRGRVEPVRVSVSAVGDHTAASQLQTAKPVTADRIRRLPLGGAIADLRAAGAAHGYAAMEMRKERRRLEVLEDELWMAGESGLSRQYQELSDEVQGGLDRVSELEMLSATAVGPQRGRPRTEHDHALVAAVYRRAYADGERVTKAVADYFQVSNSTASKRIMAARRAGHLDGVGGRDE